MAQKYEHIYKKRFSFGANWQKFLQGLNDEKIAFAEKSLSEFIGKRSLQGKTFIDVGCGSGLFSLCAVRLGAKKVISIDVDENSVACAMYLRKKYGISPSRWQIRRGSALNKKFLDSLGTADIVYSWGVLHHTGDMYSGLQNVADMCNKGSLLYIAIYNDYKGFPSSKLWVGIKRFYSGRGTVIRTAMKGVYMMYFTLGMLAYGKNPVRYIREYPQRSVRGMDFFRDVEDWLGGYPYEFASVAEIKRFYMSQGFDVVKIRKTNREGCNEFLFRRMNS